MNSRLKCLQVVVSGLLLSLYYLTETSYALALRQSPVKELNEAIYLS